MTPPPPPKKTPTKKKPPQKKPPPFKPKIPTVRVVLLTQNTVHSLGLLQTVTTGRLLPIHQEPPKCQLEYEAASQPCTESYWLRLLRRHGIPQSPSSYIVTELSSHSPSERDVINGQMLGFHILTPWCWVLLDKLTGLQLVKKFPAFHGTRRFITELTSIRHLSLSWASPTLLRNAHMRDACSGDKTIRR